MTAPRSIERTGRRLVLRGRRIGRRIARSRAARRGAAAGAILAVAFVVGVWGVVPYVVATALERWADEAPGRAAEAGRIGVDPFTLTVTLDGIAAAFDGAAVTADRVVLDFGAATLLGGRIVLDAVRVERPHVAIDAPRGAWPSGVVDAWTRVRRYRIERLEIGDAIVDWPAVSSADAGRLGRVTLVADGVDAAADTPAAFELVVDEAAGGRARAEGHARLGEREVSARVAVDGVDVGAVSEWILGRAAGAGTLSGSAHIDWRGTEPFVAFRDIEVVVRDARLVEGGGIAAAAVDAVGSVQLSPDRWTASGRAALERATLGGARGDAWLDAARIDAASFDIDLRRRPHATAPDLAGVDGMLARVEGTITADLTADIADGGRAALSLRAATAGERNREVELELRDVPAAVLEPHAKRLTRRPIVHGVVDADIEYERRGDSLAGIAAVRGRGVELGAAGDDDDERIAFGLALLEGPDGEAETTVRFDAPAGASVPEALAAALEGHLAALGERPFDALAAVLDAEDAMLDVVPFPAGEAEPDREGAEALARLAGALVARPKVGIRVHGVAEQAADRDALAAAQIELHVTLATAGADAIARPRPVDFDSPRHRDVLDEFAGERLGAERRETIASYFTRDASGAVIDAERSDYYRALFDALVESETIPRSALERLARYRARSIADALERHGVAAERIEIAPPVVRATDERDGGVDEAPLVSSTLEAFLASDAALARSAGVVFNVADHD